MLHQNLKHKIQQTIKDIEGHNVGEKFYITETIGKIRCEYCLGTGGKYVQDGPDDVTQEPCDYCNCTGYTVPIDSAYKDDSQR